jgi:hypothetical protein
MNVRRNLLVYFRIYLCTSEFINVRQNLFVHTQTIFFTKVCASIKYACYICHDISITLNDFRQCAYNVTFTRVHETIVAMENRYYIVL